MAEEKPANDKTGFFDKPGRVKGLLIVFYTSLAALLLIDPFIHKHAEFYWESAPNFFAAYGFISCVMLVLAARVLRRIIKRDEDYYER